MSFLQPILLAALPVALLPIIIHLINQRRYQTVRWGAMMFLLAASRMSRGYARIRQWLILAARVAAIAALGFVIARPLAGGWLGVTAGGKVDATILILDRSPSMRQGGASTGASKLDAGKRQLVDTLKLLGSAKWILIDALTGKPRELETIADLAALPEAGPSDARSDLPGMILAARDYVDTNKAGQADIWICSDLRASDWDAEGGRWQAIRDGFRELSGRVRFHLLAYPQPAPENRSIRVSSVRRRESGDVAELFVTVKIVRDGLADPTDLGSRETVPVQFEIGGARSEVPVELVGREGELRDHRIALEKGSGRGWGRVSIPADANPADNAFYFAFDRPKPRLAIVVAEEAEAARPLALAASISPEPAVVCSAEEVGLDRLPTVEWERVGLLLWQAPLPEGDEAQRIQRFVDRGGQVVFFPPRGDGGGTFAGVRWRGWSEGTAEVPVEGWRGDQDLLAATQSGAPLPVGQLQVRRHRALDGEVTRLATLKGGAALLARAESARGGIYFCATTPSPGDSSLATGGIVLYVLTQRALAAGASALEDTAQLDAGAPQGEDPKRWNRESPASVEGVVSVDLGSTAGVYASGSRLLAVNRPLVEDASPILPAGQVDALFQGLDYARVDDSADRVGSLIQEVWRLFLVAMMAAMVLEAALCLPNRTRAPANSSAPVGSGLAAGGMA